MLPRTTTAGVAQGNKAIDTAMLLWPTFGMELADIIQKGGGVSRLATALGLHHATVIGWRKVPPHHVPRVSEVTGIPRHELRPDLWEPPAAASQDAAA